MPGSVLPTTDEVDPRDTFSRSELLRARGYDEATIAGNGRRAEVVTMVSEDLPTIATAEVAPERTCKGCGGSMEGKSARAVWCSPRCKYRHYDNRRPNRGRKTAVAKPQVAGTANDPGPVVSGPPGAAQTEPEPTESEIHNAITNFGRLTVVVRDLVAAGLAVSFDLDGLEVRVYEGGTTR